MDERLLWLPADQGVAEEEVVIRRGDYIFFGYSHGHNFPFAVMREGLPEENVGGNPLPAWTQAQALIHECRLNHAETFQGIGDGPCQNSEEAFTNGTEAPDRDGTFGREQKCLAAIGAGGFLQIVPLAAVRTGVGVSHLKNAALLLSVLLVGFRADVYSNWVLSRKFASAFLFGVKINS